MQEPARCCGPGPLTGPSDEDHVFFLLTTAVADVRTSVGVGRVDLAGADVDHRERDQQRRHRKPGTRGERDTPAMGERMREHLSRGCGAG